MMNAQTFNHKAATMTHKQRTIFETAVFFSFACIISSLTMLGFAGVDPFAPNNALSNTTAKVAQ